MKIGPVSADGTVTGKSEFMCREDQHVPSENKPTVADLGQRKVKARRAREG